MINYLIVYIPQAVLNELSVPYKPKAREITEWANGKVIPVKNQSVITALSMNLDPGESEAMALYWETGADFLLIDEKRGRIIAQRNNIRTIGTLSILLSSKQRGFITLVKPFLELLAENGFRISDILYQQILNRAGEL